MVRSTHQKPSSPRKAYWSWALADWANSAFITTVVVAFFPIFFKKYWGTDLSPGESSFYLGAANSSVSFILLISAPFLGALADRHHMKKRLWWTLTLVGALSLMPLFFVGQGQWLMALFCFFASCLAYWSHLIFYDALLESVSTRSNVSFVSSLGFALGYLGGGLLVVVNALMVTKPEIFGLENAAQGAQWSFLSVSLWWVLFSLPMHLFVQEKPEKAERLQPLKETLKQIYHHKALFYFFLAYLFYIDGVNTIIKMSVDYALALGMEPTALIQAIILVQFIGFPATLLFACMASKLGDLTMIYCGLAIYVGISLFSGFIHEERDFYIVAICVGLAQGGLQAISRSYFAKTIPEDNTGQYFGLFNTIGKFSAVLGPLLVGATSWITGSPRSSLLIVILFFVLGALLLSKSAKHSTS